VGRQELEAHALLDEAQQAVAKLVGVDGRAQRHVQDALAVLQAPRPPRPRLPSSHSVTLRLSKSRRRRLPGEAAAAAASRPAVRRLRGMGGTAAKYLGGGVGGGALAAEARQEAFDLRKQRRPQRAHRLIKRLAPRRRRRLLCRLLPPVHWRQPSPHETGRANTACKGAGAAGCRADLGKHELLEARHVGLELRHALPLRLLVVRRRLGPAPPHGRRVRARRRGGGRAPAATASCLYTHARPSRLRSRHAAAPPPSGTMLARAAEGGAARAGTAPGLGRRGRLLLALRLCPAARVASDVAERTSTSASGTASTAHAQHKHSTRRAGRGPGQQAARC